MISNKETAAKVELVVRQCSARLNKSAQLVMETCSQDEFEAYRQIIGQIMGSIYLDIMRPIYHQHPDLEPEDLLSDEAN